jgi:hypothetical protein
MSLHAPRMNYGTALFILLKELPEPTQDGPTHDLLVGRNYCENQHLREISNLIP